jgi:hypothetical protein
MVVFFIRYFSASSDFHPTFFYAVDGVNICRSFESGMSSAMARPKKIDPG